MNVIAVVEHVHPEENGTPSTDITRIKQIRHSVRVILAAYIGPVSLRPSIVSIKPSFSSCSYPFLVPTSQTTPPAPLYSNLGPNESDEGGRSAKERWSERASEELTVGVHEGWSWRWLDVEGRRAQCVSPRTPPAPTPAARAPTSSAFETLRPTLVRRTSARRHRPGS